MKFQLRKFLLPKRKLFFPVGLLSLVLLPLLGFQTLFSDPYFHPPHVLEVSYPNKEMMNLLPAGFLTQNTPGILISGDAKSRNEKVNISLKKTIADFEHKGKESLIQIQLGKDASWADYIGILNLFHKKKLKIYVVYENIIRAYADASYLPGPKNPPKIHPPFCGTGRLVPHEHNILEGDLITSPLIPNTSKETTFQFLIKNPPYLFFLGMFSLLLLVNIFKIFQCARNSNPPSVI